jgi:hypothetical protein
VTRTQLRVEALRLAVGRLNNPNTIQLAGEYLSFLTADETVVETADTKPAQQSQARRR